MLMEACAPFKTKRPVKGRDLLQYFVKKRDIFVKFHGLGDGYMMKSKEIKGQE